MRILLNLFGMAVMAGLFYLCKLIFDISPRFGEGMATGMILMAFMLWLVERIEPSQRRE